MRKEKMWPILLTVTISILWIGAMFILAIIPDKEHQSSQPPEQHHHHHHHHDHSQQQKPIADQASSLHLMAVGDIMMHEPQITAGKTATGYDFSSFFTYIAPTLKQADLAFGNLETTLAGAEARFAGYPMFNSPDELADNLRAAHFDVITTANNHSLDRFEKGLLRTIEQLDRVGLLHTGTFKSAAERDKPLIINKNGFRLGVLAYTYSTNGIPIPKDKPYLVNMIDEKLMAKDIRAARKAGAELVIVNIHFGNEYQRKPSSQQKKTVDFLFNAGADIIFGSHPHVVQPYEVRTLKQADGRTRKGVVIYSLGNFISNQRKDPTDLGGILSVKLSKSRGNITIDNTSFIATYVHRYQVASKRVYNVLPMAQIIKNRNYPPFNENDYRVLQRRHDELMKHVISAP